MGTNAKGAFRALAQNTSKQKLKSWGEVMPCHFSASEVSGQHG